MARARCSVGLLLSFALAGCVGAGAASSTGTGSLASASSARCPDDAARYCDHRSNQSCRCMARQDVEDFKRLF
jgi:hypothetical protein